MGSDLILYKEPNRRKSLFLSYMENMTSYLKMKFPKASEEHIHNFLKAYIDNHCNAMRDRLDKVKEGNGDLGALRRKGEKLWPTIKCVKHITPGDSSETHCYGNMEYFNDYPLFDHIRNMGDKIIAPFGTCYETIDNCSSFLKGMVDTKKGDRKKEKKLMLKAKEEGDKTAEAFHNSIQASIKITMNSMPGGMGSGFNFLSSTANFNSVTSTARFIIMNAYAHAERFLESNFYFLNEEQLINHIVTATKYGPDPKTVVELLKKYKFKIPTVDDVYNFLTGELNKYTFEQDHPQIRTILETLHKGQLAFLYYMSNMAHLVMDNEWYFKPWIRQMFSEYSMDHSIPVEPTDLFKTDGDLLVVLYTVYNEQVPRNAKGNSISPKETIDNYPELAKKFTLIGRYMQSKMDEISDLFEIFMNHEVHIGYVNEHKQMFRQTVISSDTDSIIFTTKKWVEWFTGSLKVSQDAYNINALIVYWLSKANAYIMYHVSRMVGAIDKDLLTMQMKNEFMMPVDILTSLKKHYASILKIQEGVFYATPRLDIKGVELRGSNYSNNTLKYAQWFIHSMINEIYEKGTVNIRNKIVEVLRFERLIYDSLRRGEVEYLTVDPIKNMDEYANAESSIYFNYMFWESVYGQKYGSIMIPTKCYMLPLTNIRHFDYQTFLENSHPEIAKNLEAFLIKYPKKNISRIPINPLTNEIPAELKPVINYKGIVYDNTKPMYLIMQSLGLGMGNGKVNMLYSDMYGWVTTEESQKALEHIKE